MTGLSVRELSVSYGGVHAVDSVSFDVDLGSIVGLIGPNGAGKTTTIDAVCGFTPARGHLELDGLPIDEMPPHTRARRGLVRTFQSVELFDDLTVAQNLAIASLKSRWWSPIVDAIAPRRNQHVDVVWALDAVGLGDRANDRPTDLSHGQRRLVALARALVAQPKVLLLDEPAAGLDPVETAALGALLKTLPERGIGVLLVDHDMSLVMTVCSQVVVLDFGHVIATGPPEVIRSAPAVIAAYLGSAPVEGSSAS